MSKLWALTLRDVKKWMRNPFMILLMIGQPLAWLILFGKSFNFKGIINIPPEILSQLPASVRDLVPTFLEQRFNQYLEGIPDYFTFLAIGMLSVSVLFTSSFSGVSIVQDRRLGFLDKLLVSPVPRITIIGAKVLSSVVRSLVQAALLFIIALALGMHIGTSFGVFQLLGMTIVLFLLSLGLSAGYVAASITSESFETRVILGNLLNMPLMFTSNALYPLKQIPDWLQPIAAVNPISHSADAIRQLIVTGGEFTSPGILDRFAIDLGYLGVFTTITLIICLLSAKRLAKN